MNTNHGQPGPTQTSGRTTNAPATAAPTAAAAYEARANDVARLIDVLQMELEKHAEGARADAKDWGKVGDLGHVRGKLIELVSFVSGMDEKNINDFLNDSAAA